MTTASAAEGAGNAFIVGAGFSKAIDCRMPDTDALGRLITTRPDVAGHGRIPAQFEHGAFESWLSVLAGDQPYLTEPENLEQRALFGRIARALVGTLSEIEAEVLSADADAWLYELLSVFHFQHPTVVSLNYDTLLEAAVMTHSLWDGGTGRKIEVGDILQETPPNPAYAQTWDFGLAPLAQDTFRLIKLHGSLDWFWMGQDPTGLSLVRRDSLSRFGAPAPVDATTRARDLQGREPFIVAPATAKSEFYRVPVMRLLWTQALEALREARRVFLVGYSLPPADPVILGLLRDAFRDRVPELWVVNPSPEPPLSSLESLGIDRDSVTVLDGTDCVAALSRQLRDQAAGDLVTEIRGLDPTAAKGKSMFLAWGDPRAMVAPSARVGVIGFAQPDGDLLLEPASGAVSTAAASPDSPPSLADLLPRLPGVKRLVALMADGRKLPLVGSWRPAGLPPNPPSSLVIFAPAGKPQSFE
jgi:hypothetical protein